MCTSYLPILTCKGEKYDVCMLFLSITAVESLRIRGLQNSNARTCESNKGVFSNKERMLSLVNLVAIKYN